MAFLSMNNLTEIEELIKIISKLPGLGPKSAKRIVLKLINNREELIKPMAKTLADVYKNVSRCKICGTLKSNSIECSFSDCNFIDSKFDKICETEGRLVDRTCPPISGLQYSLIYPKFIYIFFLSE